MRMVSSQLPSKIEKTFDLPKVREMIMATSEEAVKQFIEFELIKLAERINVGGNLTDEQIQFIAKQLIEMYPNETIADFKICFERAAMGAYSKGKHERVFKLDGIEIGDWMGKYLDEKYKALESQLMQEKDNLYKLSHETNTDWLKVWQEAIEKTDSEGGVKTESSNMHLIAKLRGMTDKEIKEEGKEKPKYKPYPSTKLSEIEDRDLHIQYIRENYDPYTGKPKPGWIKEEEWLKNQKA